VLRDGEAADLDIDFDACRSIVQQPNGTFRLRPTLHVGEVMLNRDVVTGRVTDFATGQPIPGASTMVLVETPDADGVDRVVRQAWADPTTGTFEFCPVPTGTYDVVVSAVDSTGATFGPTVTFGVPTGTAMGDVPLVRVAATGTTLAEVRGLVETSPTPSDVEVSVLQSATPAGGTARLVTAPLLGDSVSSLSTVVDPNCPTADPCVEYRVRVVAANPNTGVFATTGTVYSGPAGGPVFVSADVRAFSPTAAGVPDCTPSRVATSADENGNPLAVAPGGNVVSATLALIGCGTTP
jgi:hypothetical protein